MTTESRRLFRKVRRFFAGWLDRQAASESAVTLTTAAFVGALAGLGAVLFRRLIQLVQHLGYEGAAGADGPLAAIAPFHLLLVPALGGLIVGPLVYRFAREAKGHGVPEVMEAVALRGGRIRPQVVVVKALASGVCIGSGGAVGREGPIVQIGSALGSTVGQALRLSDERVQNLVACGAAGGISATFNAPIAGAIFAMEVILGRLHTLYFGAVVVSAVVAEVVAHAFDGNVRAFTVPAYALEHSWELALYALLGAAAAFTAVAFTRGLYAMEDLWNRFAIAEYLKPALGGILLGAVGLMSLQVDGFPRVFGVGYETISTTLVGELALGATVALLLTKMLATSLTLGSGGSGGVFAPSLFMGAMLGSSFGQLAARLFPDAVAPSGAYALVGMSAFFAGAAHAPATAFLILFEMTRDYALILPLMLATVTSTAISRVLSRESIYTLKLSRRGVQLEHGRDVGVLEGMRVADVMNPRVDTVPISLPLVELNRELTRSRQSALPVIDESGALVGIVASQDLNRALARGAIDGLTVSDIATSSNLLVAHIDDPIRTAVRRLETRDLGVLPVVADDDPRRLIGVVSRNAINRAYERRVTQRDLRLQQGEDLGIDAGEMALVYLDIPTGAAAAGKRVSQLELPRDCLIVSLERDGVRSVVRGDTVLSAGDRVAVLVAQHAAAEARRLLTVSAG